MIRKIKSKLSVKVFLITALLMAACCVVTYFCIVRFAPYVYIYNLSNVENIAYELSKELPMASHESAATYFEVVSALLSEKYDNEFCLHLFQGSGEELSLPYLGKTTGKRIEAFENIETTTRYTISFTDETDNYILFISKNTEKESQVVEALQKALPALSVVILIVSVIVAFFYSWYMTVPIKKVSKISKQMADMDFSGLSPIGRTDEIGVLSNSLNELSGKLTTALTELQEANQKLQADIDKERQLEHQRLEFFSAASHELKTPITIIKGQLHGMLCQIGRYKDRDTYLAQSLEVTNTLEQMVQELLTISRLETPGYTYNKSRFDFGQLVNERLSAFDDLLVQKELSVKKSLSSEIHLFGDAQLLQKAVDNLLGNAVSYSPVGSEIFVKLWPEEESVYLTIENTGVHIMDEAIPKLFEAFYRVDQSRNRQTGGSGLGLYIVKTILDRHGAKIQIANSPRGVIVTIQF